MAHFAVLDKDNKVIFVTPVANEKITVNNIEVEQLGVDFLFNIIKIQNIYTDAITAKQTSYNNSFRNKYAGIGDEYIEDLDIFRSPQPYPSWILNEDETEWVAPIEKPNGNYYWNEETLNWIEL